MKFLSIGAAALAMMAWQPMQETTRATYLNGEAVAFEIAPAAPTDKAASFGPWKLGAKVVESKPRDGRLNLYVVIPGDDFQSPDEAQSLYDHNRVINMAPRGDGEADYDVYWVLGLEPHLNRDFHGETELLAAAQRRFIPSDLFELRDAPAAGFMKEVLRMERLEQLRPYRRKDGSLPTVIIIPAGFAVRGAVRP